MAKRTGWKNNRSAVEVQPFCCRRCSLLHVSLNLKILLFVSICRSSTDGGLPFFSYGITVLRYWKQEGNKGVVRGPISLISITEISEKSLFQYVIAFLKGIFFFALVGSYWSQLCPQIKLTTIKIPWISKNSTLQYIGWSNEPHHFCCMG